jgi:4-alpha-glucanotransferase
VTVGRKRAAGVLLHVTSLPGPYGIGDLGPNAFRWVDALSRAGQTWWQILPLGPPGCGNSPYQCFSAFAGNPCLISPQALARDGLLTRAELRDARNGQPGAVEYEHVSPIKGRLIARAWERFNGGAARPLHSPFEEFCAAQSGWLDDYAAFMTIREMNGAMPDWPRDLHFYKPQTVEAVRHEWPDAVGRHRFAQFIFFRQLDALRDHAHGRGVKLVGDLPIYVSCDSADVWANPHLFKLDRRRRPTAISGVPPDLFARTGQCWGNPVYDWRAAERENYAWWVTRLKATFAQVDLVRIDHFRGFAAYWEIPAGQRTAVRGRWVRGPGPKLFDVLREKLGGLPVIAEDLGLITPDVVALRDQFNLPGMRVLQFAFGDRDNPHLPHNYLPNCIAYTGTHDNDTSAGWFASLTPKQRDKVRSYLCDADEHPARAMIRAAWGSVANLAIAPLQDVMGLGSEARMNYPGTAVGNWRWRMGDGDLKIPGLLDWLEDLTRVYER